MRLVRKYGFTIIELMLTIGIIGTIAGIVIAAINPSAQLTTAYDAGRRSTARSLEQAIAQYTIDVGQVPGHVAMPTSAQTAIPICRPSGSGGTCILLNELAPEYLGQIPIDGSEENDEWTGYSVYLDGPQVRVIANNLGTTGNGLLASSTYFGQKTYGGTGSDFGADIVQLDDGNFVFIGTTYSTDGDITDYYGEIGNASSSAGSSSGTESSTSDIWLVKITDAGAIMWQRSLGTTDNDTGQEIVALGNDVVVSAIIETADNDVSTAYGSYDIWVARIDSSGNVLWEETYGSANRDRYPRLNVASDGNIILSYMSFPGIFESTGNLYSIKLSPDGTEIWNEQLTDATYYQSARVVPSDDGFLYTFNYKSSSPVAMLIEKRDVTNNNLIWQRSYDQAALSLIPSGCSDGTSMNSQMFAMICGNNTVVIDEVGDVVWTHAFTYGSNKTVHRIFYHDNRLIIVGQSTGCCGLPSLGYMDALVYSLTDDGTMEWSNGYGSSFADFGIEAAPIDDGKILVIGHGYEPDGIDDDVDQTDDIWIFELDENGRINQ